MFELVSPAKLRAWRTRDRKRRDLQAVAGVEEIVQLYQDEMAGHIYRRGADGTWSFDMAGGAEAMLGVRSVGIAAHLGEGYKFTILSKRSGE